MNQRATMVFVTAIGLLLAAGCGDSASTDSVANDAGAEGGSDTGVSIPGDASAGCRAEKKDSRACSTARRINPAASPTARPRSTTSSAAWTTTASMQEPAPSAKTTCALRHGTLLLPRVHRRSMRADRSDRARVRPEPPMPSEGVPANERMPDELRLQHRVLSAAHVHDRRGLPRLLRQWEMRQRARHL